MTMNRTRKFAAAALAAAMSMASIAGVARAEEADPYVVFPGSLGPVKVGMKDGMLTFDITEAPPPALPKPEEGPGDGEAEREPETAD